MIWPGYYGMTDEETTYLDILHYQPGVKRLARFFSLFKIHRALVQQRNFCPTRWNFRQNRLLKIFKLIEISNLVRT